MIAMGKICEGDVPMEAQAQLSKQDESFQRVKNVYWSNKERCVQILFMFLQRFANNNIIKPIDKPYAARINAEYLAPFLKIFAKALLKRRTQHITEKYTCLAAKYCYYALGNNRTFYAMLNEHLEELLFDAFLPMAYLNSTDLQCWRSDPIEFVHRQEDYSDMKVRSQGLNNVNLICKGKALNGEFYLVKFMIFARNVLVKGENPRTGQKADDLLIEAILVCIYILEDQINLNKVVRNQMELLLEECIIPLFNSESGLLRAAVCKLFSKYAKIELEAAGNLISMVNGLYKCLTDKELPVRVYVSGFTL